MSSRERTRDRGGKGGVGVPLISNPTIAILGPSTTHRNNAEASHIVYNITSGPHVWAKTIDPRFQYYNYYNASDPLSRNFTGNNYGLDSDPISNQITRISGIKSSNARIVVWNTGRGASDVFAGQTLAGYCDPVKTSLLDLKTSGKIIIWENLWMRNTSTGGDWASGGAARTLLLQINAEMTSWCQANGIVVADVYTVMTDLADPDLNPKAGYFSSDGIHYSARGAYRTGKYYTGIYSGYLAAYVTYDNADALNIMPQKLLTGTGGTLSNGALGVAPDNWTLARGGAGNARSLTGSIEVINTKNWMVMTVGSSGSIPAAGEGFTFRLTTIPATGILTLATWYRARLKVIIDNWAGWTGIKLIAQDGAGTPNGGADNAPGSGVGGNVPLTGFSGSDQYAIVQDAESWYLETPPFLAGNVDVTIRLNVNYVSASGSGVLKVGEFDLRAITNPATIIG